MLARVLLYKDFFDGEKPRLADLLSNISSELIIEVLSFINAELFLNNSLEKQSFIFHNLISGIDNIEKKRLEDIYNGLSEESELIAFPIASNLKLTERELLTYRSIENYKLNGIDELNILKAIIITNEEFDDNNLSKTKIKPKPDLIRLMWAIGYEQLEHSSNGINSLLPSLYYANELLEYLKEEYPENFSIFLQKLGIDNHQKYLTNFLHLIQNGINIEQNKANSLFKLNLIEKHPFLAPFCIDAKNLNREEYIESSKNVDFIGLREKPIIKHSEESFTITNWNFLLNKFLLGLMFDYYHSIYPERGNKAFLKFKENLGENFVEKGFLYNVLHEIFDSDTLDIELLSDDKELGYNFDFYLRIENKIFLFECKDYLMPSKVKSGQIEEIEKYINNRFGGAVNQLEKQIQKINNSTYETIKLPYPKERIFVYPIIIYTDKSFSMLGINSFLSKKLKEILSKKENDFFHMWDLNMIHIDFFIQHKNILQKNPKLFISLLNDAYHSRNAAMTSAQITLKTSDVINALSYFEEQIGDKLMKIKDHDLFETIIKLLKP